MSPKKAIIILLILLLLTTIVFAFLYFNEKNKYDLNIQNNFLPISEVKKKLTLEEKKQLLLKNFQEMSENKIKRNEKELTLEEKKQLLLENFQQMSEK